MGPSHKLNMIARVCEHDAGPSTDKIRPDIVTVDFTQTKQQEYLNNTITNNKNKQTLSASVGTMAKKRKVKEGTAQTQTKTQFHRKTAQQVLVNMLTIFGYQGLLYSKVKSSGIQKSRRSDTRFELLHLHGLLWKRCPDSVCVWG